MGREKKADRDEARKSEARQPKKPYVRPVLRRLGTVRELTHGHPSKAIK